MKAMQSTIDSHNSELIAEPSGKVEEDEILHGHNIGENKCTL